MRHTILIATLIFAASASAFAADSSYDREFKQLTEQRDKALTAAAEPINRRYQTSLEQLLRRATQANDLDTAIKIKEALKTLGVVSAPANPPAKITKRELAKEIVGSWVWAGEKAGLWILVKPDGTASLDSKHLTWKTGTDGAVTFMNDKKQTATVTLDAEMKSFSGVSFTGNPITGTKGK